MSAAHHPIGIRGRYTPKAKWRVDRSSRPVGGRQVAQQKKVAAGRSLSLFGCHLLLLLPVGTYRQPSCRLDLASEDYQLMGCR